MRAELGALANLHVGNFGLAGAKPHEGPVKRDSPGGSKFPKNRTADRD